LPSIDTINRDALTTDAGRNFYDVVIAYRDQVNIRDIESTLETLAGLKPAVDIFFDGVMINDPDETVKQQRLVMLASVINVYKSLVDLNQIETR